MAICAIPLRNARWRPNREFRNICNEIRNIEGHGDQILATLEDEIVEFQNDAVIATQGGLRDVLDGNRANGFGSPLYSFLND